MKKTVLSIMAVLATIAASAQNTQEAAAAAAAALSAAEDVPEKVEVPKYWNSKIVSSINFGQTMLSQWAAGGYNNVSLAGNIDATANYAKGKLIGANRLQLDYGFLYSEDKPILQKNKDRIYFESKWGYETPVRHLSYSASFDFLTQFSNNYDYKTPTSDGATEPTSEEWLDARVLKSGLFSPAYINLGLGLLWTPKPWFSLNVAPLTGGFVVVADEKLRKTYGMDLKEDGLDATVGGNYRSSRFQLGAQVKADAAWVINDVFSYSTQVTAFYDYLTPKVEPRITWDNKVIWKLRKFFALTVGTNLIYDPKVYVNPNREDGKGVQFKEYLEFGFTYTITKQH